MKILSCVLLAAAIMVSVQILDAQQGDARFDALTTDFLKGFYAANPISATGIGVHDFDNLLDDVSPAALLLESQRLRQVKLQLAGIDAKSLSKSKNIDYRLLVESVDESIFGLDELKETEWNPLVYTIAIGNSIASLIYQEFAPLDQRLKNAAQRASLVPKFLDQAKKNLKNK